MSNSKFPGRRVGYKFITQADSAFHCSGNAVPLNLSITAFLNTIPSNGTGKQLSSTPHCPPIPGSPWHLRSNKVVNSSIFYSHVPCCSGTGCSREQVQPLFSMMQTAFVVVCCVILSIQNAKIIS